MQTKVVATISERSTDVEAITDDLAYYVGTIWGKVVDIKESYGQWHIRFATMKDEYIAGIMADQIQKGE